jgi:hypothetical protein
MYRTFSALLIVLLAIVIPCLAQSTEPVGPTGWTTRNWIGFSVQITVFVLAIIAICKLARWGE